MNEIADKVGKGEKGEVFDDELYDEIDQDLDAMGG